MMLVLKAISFMASIGSTFRRLLGFASDSFLVACCALGEVACILDWNLLGATSLTLAELSLTNLM